MFGCKYDPDFDRLKARVSALQVLVAELIGHSTLARIQAEDEPVALAALRVLRVPEGQSADDVVLKMQEAVVAKYGDRLDPSGATSGGGT